MKALPERPPPQRSAAPTPRRLTGPADLGQREQQLADALAERLRQQPHPLIHIRRCVDCERYINRYVGRRCKLCMDIAQLYGLVAAGAMPEREVAFSALGEAERKQYDAATVDHEDGDLVGLQLRQELLNNPHRWSICKAYVELRGNVSAVAKKVGLDRKTVRHHLADHRERLDRVIREGAEIGFTDENVNPTPGSGPSHSAVMCSRAELYAFGSDGRRIPKPVNEFDVRCESCGTKQRYCVGKCCGDCWHPRLMRVRETRRQRSRG